jgi:hypothetical protein
MGNLLFWLGIGAAQKGAGSKPIERRHRALSFAVGILVALVIAVGLLFSQQRSGARWPQRTNLWREQAKPRTGSERPSSRLRSSSHFTPVAVQRD